MNMRTLVLTFFGLGLFLQAIPAQPQQRKYEPLYRAIGELRQAKKYLPRETCHEQVQKAHRALKDAIKYVAESRAEFAGRRQRLIERLEVLDKQLERNHTKAERALDEAIEDLEFAVKH